jgi:hypothetical protein
MPILSKKEVVSPALRMLSCHAEEKNGAIYPELALSSFLSVDAIVPGSVMSNAIASHPSIPRVTPKNKRDARVKRQAYLLQR